MRKDRLVDVTKLQPGPIRHTSLAPTLLQEIRAIFQVVAPYTNMNLEQFEIGFMRDAHPEREVAIWDVIAQTLETYCEKFMTGKALPKNEGRNILGALIAISTGVKDVERMNVPKQVGRRLLEFYYAD